MTTLTSNTFWNSPDGQTIRIQELLATCDFCDHAHNAEEVERVDGYYLCPDCKTSYESDFTLSI